MANKLRLVDQVITTNEAMAILGVANRTVCYLCDSGEIAARKSGGTWLIERASVEAYKPFVRSVGKPRKKQRGQK